MVHQIRGKSLGRGRRVGVVVSRFNEEITERLLKGCLEGLSACGVRPSRIDVVSVPGAVEIPSACLWMAQTKRYHALIALGAVIRGETPHFEYVSRMASQGISRVSLNSGIPIAFGVLTTENFRQAMNRSGKKDNKGKEAARAALEMADLSKKLKR